MAQAGEVGVVGVAVAAQMHLEVQEIATNQVLPILSQTQGLAPTVLCNQVSFVKPVRGGRQSLCVSLFV